MPSAPAYLGLDVGGTQVKAGLVTAAELDARALGTADLPPRTETVDTDLDAGVDAFFDRLADFARELLARVPAGAAPARIGLGFPGVFAAGSTVLVRSANLHPVEGRDLRLEVARRLRLEPSLVSVGNDANLATYGEQWLGAGRGLANLVLLTLGTGVGGGIVLDGRLFTGAGGQGAEIGHLIVRSLAPGEPEQPGLRCGCGAYGCLERLVSATAAERRAREAGLAGSLELLADRARRGESDARALFHAVGRDLGTGLLSVGTLLDIPTVLIGGGFSAALDVLLPGIQDALAERDYGGDGLRILPAALGGAAGWIGAVRLAAEDDGLTVVAPAAP